MLAVGGENQSERGVRRGGAGQIPDCHEERPEETLKRVSSAMHSAPPRPYFTLARGRTTITFACMGRYVHAGTAKDTAFHTNSAGHVVHTLSSNSTMLTNVCSFIVPSTFVTASVANAHLTSSSTLAGGC